MKLSCQEPIVPGKSFAEKLKFLEKSGFEGMELNGGVLRDPAKRKELKAALKGSKIPPSVICGGVTWSSLFPNPKDRQKSWDEAVEIIELGAELDCPRLIFVPIFGGPQISDLSPWKNPWDTERAVLVEALGRVAERIEKIKGGVLILEPLNRYETHFLNRLEQAEPIVEEVGSKAIKLMGDFFHMNIEEVDIAKAIKKNSKHLAHIHIADSTRRFPGHGHTDFVPGFKALAEAGYKGYMSWECWGPSPHENYLGDSVKYIRGKMKEAGVK